jgi:ribosomal protein L21E
MPITLVGSEERDYGVKSRIEVGDLVLICRDGRRRRSAAARKYAGKKGKVTLREEGYHGIVVDVRIEENNFDTVFEEQDLIRSFSSS